MQPIKIHIPIEDIALIALIKNNTEPGWASIGRNGIHDLICRKAFQLGITNSYIGLIETALKAEWVYFRNGKFAWSTEELPDHDDTYKEIPWKDFLMMEEG